MTYIVYSPIFERHITGAFHPERPQRVQVIVESLRQSRLVPEDHWLLPRRASKEELMLCHDPQYIDLVRHEVESLQNGRRQLMMLSVGDVVICPESYEVALHAVGAVLVAADTMMNRQGRRFFCPVRPPGHHATPYRGMGFCLFNNVAIGVKYLQRKYSISRVLIVDWDLHHGNGTADIFNDDPSVFYFSTHQEGIFPGTGKREECGNGGAEGTMCNIPIDEKHSAREAIFAAIDQQLIPAMEKFRPEVVFISAGFDGHRADPFGVFDLESNDFLLLTKKVCTIADTYAQGRVISVLEGGYNLEVLGECAVLHVKGMGEEK